MTVLVLLPSARVDSSTGSSLRFQRVIETDTESPGEPDFFLLFPRVVRVPPDIAEPEPEFPGPPVCPFLEPVCPREIVWFDGEPWEMGRIELEWALQRARMREHGLVDASARVPTGPRARPTR